MREITLYPGESITIDGTIIKAVQRGAQINTPFPIPTIPQPTRKGHYLDSPVRTTESPAFPWTPETWPYRVIC